MLRVERSKETRGGRGHQAREYRRKGVGCGTAVLREIARENGVTTPLSRHGKVSSPTRRKLILNPRVSNLNRELWLSSSFIPDDCTFLLPSSSQHSGDGSLLLFLSFSLTSWLVHSPKLCQPLPYFTVFLSHLSHSLARMPKTQKILKLSLKTQTKPPKRRIAISYCRKDSLES